MFLLKLIAKILLLPLMMLLWILRLLIKIGMEISSFVLGALMLIVFACIVFTIFQHTWNSMMILIAMEVLLVLMTAGTALVEGLLEAAGERVGRFMRS
jgi:hypothetical protein